MRSYTILLMTIFVTSCGYLPSLTDILPDFWPDETSDTMPDLSLTDEDLANAIPAQSRPASVATRTSPASSTGSSFSNSDLACMTEVIYFEARGESNAGKRAVAHVVKNRRNSRHFPNSICAVIHQGEGRGRACQFSYRCDGRPEHYNEPNARANARRIAQRVLSGDPDPTHGALYFHTRNIRPHWASAKRHTVTIGNHVFRR